MPPASRPVGLYIHVPFCQSRCIYCDFYSTTCGREQREAYVKALCREVKVRQDEAEGSPLSTIYIGGGTPSCLAAEGLERIFAAVDAGFCKVGDAEVTLEANPDDITPALCRRLKAMGVNRVSLGVQTFNDAALRFLRRRHTAEQARIAVETLAAEGIENLSIDLIYGLPGQDVADWKADLRQALGLPVTHLSAYALMFEEGTRLTALRDRGEVRETDDEVSLQMFRLLIGQTAAAGMEHYEISNFARPGYASRHNSSYWTGCPYIGLGPGAHSYDGRSLRRCNAANLEEYIAFTVEPPHETEQLTLDELCNERIFTSLRTRWGLDMAALEAGFGRERAAAVASSARRHVAAGLLEHVGGCLKLTQRGIFLSDMVMSDLMLDGE